MKTQFVKRAYGFRLIGLMMFFSVLCGCKKNDHFTINANDESANVVFDWYKLQLQMLLHANPATNNSANINNFGYIGVGLYEAVRN